MLNGWLKRPRVPRHLLWIATVGLGVGVGGYTFLYAKGFSYMSNRPAVCANCHVMQEYYDGWAQGVHHNVATCNDCHTPHNLIGKYMTKAENGFHHSRAFTLQNFRDTIIIRQKNADIVEHNCLRCHEEMAGDLAGQARRPGENVDCVRCHGGVGHGLE
jgi:cytochrome c nitrite reductase small subunit